MFPRSSEGKRGKVATLLSFPVSQPPRLTNRRAAVNPTRVASSWKGAERRHLKVIEKKEKKKSLWIIAVLYRLLVCVLSERVERANKANAGLIISTSRELPQRPAGGALAAEWRSLRRCERCSAGPARLLPATGGAGEHILQQNIRRCSSEDLLPPLEAAALCSENERK